MIRSRLLGCSLALLGCEESDESEETGTTEAVVDTTGAEEPWWLGQFHDAELPVGSNATLLFVGNLEIRDDGTATGTSAFCDDPPELAEYAWTMAGDALTLTGDPLLWETGEVASITVTRGSACDEIDIAVETLAGSTTNATYARGETCLETTGPSCAVEVVWCGAEPPACA